MSELNDSSAIKLFGKMIPLLTLADHHELSFREAAREDCCDRNLLCSSNSLAAMNPNVGLQAQVLREDKESIEKEFHNQPLAERETSSLEISKNEEKSEPNASQEKILKKPDKLLPCPRCNSKETKFCYYNNYNVNQPRHFCKKCQRYWTAGGAMRNVPVGAGRRKTKGSSALHYHYIEAMIRAVEASPKNGIHQNPETKNNSCVITFGSESSVNFSGKPRIDVQRGARKPEQRILVEDNHSGESLITASYCLDQKATKANLSKAENKSYQFFPSKVPCLTGPPWPYPRGSIHCSTAMLPPLPPRTLFPPGFSAPTYRPSPWDVPVASPSPAPSSSPTSAALGKHLRDEKIFNPANMEKEKLSGSESNKSEGRALNSKISRIDDDPLETAKSSMLATLMIKTKDTNSINPGGLFDGFQSKISDNRNYRPGTTTTFSVLRANPVGLSRSINFHENT